jgi:hypothetical protein
MPLLDDTIIRLAQAMGVSLNELAGTGRAEAAEPPARTTRKRKEK